MAKSRMDRSVVSVNKDDEELQEIGESEIEFKDRLRKIGSLKTIPILRGELNSMGFAELPNSKKLKKEVVEEWVQAKVSIGQTQFAHSSRLERGRRNLFMRLLRKENPGNKKMRSNKNKSSKN
jgi:hypothetical protein